MVEGARLNERSTVMVADMRTARDTANQEQVARILERQWGCFMHLAQGRYARVNYVASHDHAWEQPFALVEVKCRNIHSTSFETTMLAYQKFKAMRFLHQKYNLSVRFVVAFTDCLYWIDIDDVDGRDPEIGGREPRPGAVNDQEPVIYIPIENMRRVPRR